MTPPPEKGTYYAHPLPPPIVGLLTSSIFPINWTLIDPLTRMVLYVWIGHSRVPSHMTRNADLLYDSRPPPPHWTILVDVSLKKVCSSTAEMTSQSSGVTYR